VPFSGLELTESQVDWENGGAILRAGIYETSRAALENAESSFVLSGLESMQHGIAS